MQLDGYRDRVAVVTGAAQGIGSEIAECFVRQGARVAGLDLRPPEIDGVLGLRADITDQAVVGDAFDQIESDLGPTEILVLNAGIFIVEPFAGTSLENWRQTMDVNLTGAFLCAQRSLPSMVQTGYGRVIAVGSTAGLNGGKSSCAAYAASKAGLMCLVKSIANEYASSGVTSNAIAPALIDTAMMAAQPEGIEEQIPVGRRGTAAEIADLVAYLCSEHAGFITGEVVDINGGFLVN